MSIDVRVSARGEVSQDARRIAGEKFAALERVVNAPLTDARVVLVQEANPRIPEPAHADAEIRVAGTAVRASASGRTMEAAVDEVVERLARNMRRFVDKIIDHHHEPSEPR